MMSKPYEDCGGCGRMFNMGKAEEVAEMLRHDCNEDDE